MNRMTKKRVGMVLAFSLTLTGAAAYIGIQQGNTDKTEAAGSLKQLYSTFFCFLCNLYKAIFCKVKISCFPVVI